MSVDLKKARALVGAGGGGKSGGSKDDKNNLRSNATARILYALGEGPIKGIVGGGKGIYFDDTPLMSDTDEKNFKGVTWAMRSGLPDQPVIPDFEGVENTITVGQEATEHVPVVRSLTDPDFDACRVTINIPALVKQTDEGMKKYNVQFRIDVRYDGGAWQSPFGSQITIEGKQTSGYEKSYQFLLPKNPNPHIPSYPWDVRVVRISGDNDDPKLQNSVFFQFLTGIINTKLIYPDTALLALAFNAEEFEQGLPEVAVDGEGRTQILIPSNYDPATRTYSGIWDGTFTTGYSDNPAWVFYDMLVNDRYGLGELLESVYIDKWSLYDIGKNCDISVPDGYGGFEPRFKIGAYIKSAEEAYDMMQYIASAFRGMIYWASGAITASQDVPADPEVLVAPGNVIGGEFNYTSSAMTSRHTIAHVRYQDPNDLYRDAVEVVVDHDAMLRYGPRVKEIEAWGCTSRGQARRLGLWILLSELYETNTVTYQAGMDHSFVRPGGIIHVADPNYSNADFGGRLAGVASASSLTLDRPVELEVGKTYTFHATLPNGDVVERAILTSGTTAVVTLASALPEPPLVGSIWVISSPEVSPRPFRVLSVGEIEPHIYEVAALEHYTPKYAIIDGDAKFDPPSYRKDRDLQPPGNVKVEEFYYFVANVPKSSLNISWMPASGSLPSYFDVEIDTPDNGTLRYQRVTENFIEVPDVVAGEYTIRVYAVGAKQKRSSPATEIYEATGWSGQEGPSVVDLELVNGVTATEFKGRDVQLRWRNLFFQANAPTTSLFYDRNVVSVFDAANGALLREETVRGTSYSYTFDKNAADNLAIASGKRASRSLHFEVTQIDTLARESAPAELGVTNPAPAAPTVTLEPRFNEILVSWASSDDGDYAGTAVWAYASPGAALTNTNRLFNGVGNIYSALCAPDSTLYVRVGHYDAFDPDPANLSAEQSATALGLDVDTTPPAVPTGLTLTSVLQGDGSVRLTADWNDNGEADLGGYELLVKEGTGNWVPFPTGNVSVWERTVGPNIAFLAQVRAYDQAGNRSAYTAIVSHTTAKDTTPPAVPTGFSATGMFEHIWLQWTMGSESDLAYYEVYEGATATAPTAATAATYTNITGAQFTRSGLGNAVTKHFWVRAVDTSENKSAWSARAQGTTVSVTLPDITLDALGVPGVPILSSTVRVNQDGTVQSEVFAEWSSAANAVSYELGVTPSGGYEGWLPASESGLRFMAQPGLALSVRVRAVGALGLKGQASGSASITPAGDALAPAVPTNLTVTSGLKELWLKWDANTERDLAHYEIFEQDAATPAPTAGSAGTYRSAGTTLARTGLPSGVTRHYWVRAVDTSGNKSAWSVVASGTTTNITSVDIDAVIGTSSYAQSIQAPKVVSVLPNATTYTASKKVYLTTDQKLYQRNAAGTGWVEENAATLLVGQIVAGQIAVGAVGADQIAAKAISVEKLAVTGAGNAINPDPYFEDASLWTTNGGAVQSVLYPYAISGGRALRATGPQAIYYDNHKVPIDPSKQYLFVHQFASVGSGVYYGVWRFWDASGNVIGTAGSVWPTGSSNNFYMPSAMPYGAGGAWTKGQAVVGPGTSLPLPANARYVSFGALTNYNGSGDTVIGQIRISEMTRGELIVDGAVQARHLIADQAVITGTAQIADAIITSAKVVSLSAAKLEAGSALAGSITVSGTALSDTTARAADPAARINAGVTTILPGKIVISGATTLEAWRYGNTTTIDGGMIQANTVTAEKIQAGSITAREMILTDTSNLVEAPTFTKSDGVSPASASWELSNPAALYLTATPYNPHGLNTIQGIGTGYAYNRKFTARAGDHFLLAATVYANITSGVARVYLQFFDKNDASLGSTFVEWTSADGASFVQKTTTTVAPAGTARARCFLEIYQTTGTIVYFCEIGVFRRADANLVVDGAITASKLAAANVVTLSAQIADAIITSAKIVSLAANKIEVGALNAGITVGSTGVSIGTVESRASDPAARINAAATIIEPGKIRISGSSTLSDWRMGGDETRINGGMISANTIDANKLTVGLRGLTVEGLEFEHNRPGVNNVYWSGGTISYKDSNGNPVSVTVPANAAAWTSGTVYVYFRPGDASLGATTSISVASQSDRFVLATYKGGTNLLTQIGRTIIDGSHIKTGTITAAQADLLSLRAGILIADSIQGNMIAANGITARHMTLSDTSNLLAAPTFTNNDGTIATTSWLTSGGALLDTTSYSSHSKYAVVHNLSGSPQNGYAWNVNEYIPCTAGAAFTLMAEVYTNLTSGTVRVYAWFYDKNGSPLGYDFLSWGLSESFVRKSKIVTAPAGAAKVRVLYENYYCTGTVTYLTTIGLVRAATAELVVDGSIKASHIVAGTLTATQIQLGGLTYDRFPTGEINQLVTAAPADISGIPSKNTTGNDPSTFTWTTVGSVSVFNAVAARNLINVTFQIALVSNTSDQGHFRILRNSVPIYVSDYLAYTDKWLVTTLAFMDTGAAAGTTNTYTLQACADGNTVGSRLKMRRILLTLTEARR